MFKNFAFQMQKKNHSILFTVREGENESSLLDFYGFKYILIGKKQKRILCKIFFLPIFTLRIFLIAYKFKPDIYLSHGSMYAAYASVFSFRKHISMEDSGNTEQIRLYAKFTDTILTPDILPLDLGVKQIRYRGYHELMYLLPKYFTPNPEIFNILGISPGEKYAILRFVSWEATHDKNHKGLSKLEKNLLVKELSQRMKVFISAEKEIPYELESYRINISFERMHDVLAYAYVYVGEGATMASEAGVLGVPSIYVSSIERCYNIDQEKYGTVLNVVPSNKALKVILEYIDSIDLKLLKKNRNRLISSKIDTTAFLVWFVENYTQSIVTMKENPDYQNNFVE
jgi:hypothetical protein